MKIKMNKKVAVVMAILVLSLALASTAFAADNYKNLKAWFGDIKVFHNNTQVQLKDKPFIVDGTTYLPVRSIGELFDMNITWDQANKHVGLNDKVDTSYNEMVNKFIMQEVKILELEAKVKDLESKLKAKEEAAKVTTLTDMEKQLNKSYGTSDKINFDIDLYGTTSKVEVRIYIDDRTSSDRWSYWSTSDNKAFLQDITDDILKEFKNAKISGFIQDKYPTKTIKTSFDVSSRGTVSVDTKYDDSYYGDIERDLNNDYTKTVNGIDKIKVSESWNSVYITVEVDTWDWDSRNPSTSQKRLLEDMSWKVIRDYNYNYSDVSGIVVDYYGDELYEFDFNSSGTVRIY